MKKSKNVRFGILGIRELEFHLKYPYPLTKSFDPLALSLEAKVNVNYKWNLDSNLFGVVVDFFYVDKTNKGLNSELLKFTFVVEFNIENLKDVFIVRDNNDFDIDEKIESSLVSISISTGRGILYEKISGTFLSNYIFPIVDASKLLVSKKLKEHKANKN